MTLCSWAQTEDQYNKFICWRRPQINGFSKEYRYVTHRGCHGHAEIRIEPAVRNALLNFCGADKNDSGRKQLVDHTVGIIVYEILNDCVLQHVKLLDYIHSCKKTWRGLARVLETFLCSRDKWFVCTGVVNSDSKQFALLMVKIAMLTTETYSDFIIQINCM